MLTNASTRLLVVVAAVAAVVLVATLLVIQLRDDDPAGPSGSAAAPATPATRPSPTCSRYAAVDGGDDNADGSEASPLRTVQRLVGSLEPGQTGCLAAGEYDGDVEITTGGSPGRPITVTAADPAQHPLVRGRIVVNDSANDVVISGLVLNGRNGEKLPSPTINGDNVVLLDNEITSDNFGICINLGHEDFGTAVGTVIQDNRIHNCGEYPVTNLEHGIYVGVARDTTITGNLIYNNADRGIQLYPDAQNTRITNNVIDGNGTGVIFSGANGTVSSNNYVGHNIITNSVRYNIDAFWDDANGVGQNNVVEDNCIWGAGIENVSDQDGFSVLSNFTVDPEFDDRSAARFTVAPGSPCASRLPSWLAS